MRNAGVARRFEVGDRVIHPTYGRGVIVTYVWDQNLGWAYRVQHPNVPEDLRVSESSSAAHLKTAGPYMSWAVPVHPVYTWVESVLEPVPAIDLLAELVG